MPRSSQSPEAKILGWFQTAPLAAARLVLGLAKGTLAAREEKGERLKSGWKKRKAKKVQLQPAGMPVTRVMAPAKPKAKKSHHKKKGLPGSVPAAAQVEDFAHTN